MPFEALVSKILTKVLGDYLEGLAAENIDISILSGSVVHENLHLKKTAFDALALPVVVKNGFLGKLTLNVPWKNLSSQPTTVTLDRLYVLLCPAPRSQYDPKLDERKLLNTKLRRLELAELVRGKEENEQQAKKDEKPSLVSVILSNMQIDVHTLHIRYEDDISHTNSIVIGVTLEHLRVVTTDETWKPAFLTSPKIAFKLVELQNLSVYCNSGSPFLQYKDTKELEALLESLISTTARPVTTHHYVISPLSGRLKLTLNLAENLTQPKTSLQFELPDLQVMLEENQYRDLLALWSASVHYVLGMEYRKLLPPLVRPLGNAKVWWAFALRAVRADVARGRERWKWRSIKAHKQDRLLYVALWKSRKKLSEEQKKQLEAMDARLSYEDLFTFRSLAHALKKLEKTGKLVWQEKLSKERAKDTAVGAFFSKIFDDKKSNVAALTTADWRLMYGAIGFDDTPISASASLPKDYVKQRINLVVSKGSITFNGSQFDPRSKGLIAVANFGGLRVGVEVRDGKRTNVTTNGSMANLELIDHYSYHGKSISVLSAPFELRRLLEWSLEVNPLPPRDEDLILKLMLEPVEFIIARPMLERIVDFLTQPHASRPVMPHADSDIVLVPQLERPLQIDMRIDIEAPTIILPEDFERENAPSLVLPVHLISICTDYSLAKPPAIQRVMKNPPEDLIESYFYRRFSIKVTKLQAFVAPRGDDWKRQLAEEQLAMIADQQNVSLLLAARVEPSLKLPTLRVTGDLPAVSLSISDRDLATILRVIDEITEGPPRNLPYLVTPPPKSPINEFVVDVTLRGEDVQFLLYESDPHRDLLQAAGTNITFSFNLFDHYTSLKLSAASIRGIDKLQPLESPFARFVTTGGSGMETSVVLNYTGVSKTSPRFAALEHEVALSFPAPAKIVLNPEVLFATADLVLAAVDSTDERKFRNLSRFPKSDDVTKKPDDVFTLIKLTINGPEARGSLHLDGGSLAQIDAGVHLQLVRRTNKTMDVQLQLRAMRVLCLSQGDPTDAGSLKDDQPLAVEYSNFATPFGGGFEAKLAITAGTVFLHTLPFFLKRMKDWAVYFVSVLDKSKIITNDPHSKKMQVSAAIGSIFLLVFQNSRARDGPCITAKISQLEVSNRLLDPVPDKLNVLKEEMLVSVNGVFVTSRQSTSVAPSQIVRLGDCAIKVESSSEPGQPRYVSVLLDCVPLSITHHQAAFILEMLRGQIMDYPLPLEVLRGVPLHPGVRELELQVNVTVRSLSLDMLIGVNEEAPLSLLAFKAGSLSATVELFADDYVSLRIGVATLCLDDARSAIRNLVRNTPLASNQPALQLRLGYEPDKAALIEVDGGGVSFSAAPDSTLLVGELAQFLAPRVKAVMRALEQRDAKAPPAPSTLLSVRVALRALTVQLPVDLSRVDGKCIAVVLDTATASLSEKSAQTHINLQLIDVSIVKVEQGEQFALLQPMKLSFELLSGVETGMHGTVCVSELLVMLSMRDVKLLLKALEPWATMDALIDEPATRLILEHMQPPSAFYFRDTKQLESDIEKLTATLQSQEASLHAINLSPNERMDAAEALLSICRQVHGRVLQLVGAEHDTPTTHEQLLALNRLINTCIVAASEVPGPVVAVVPTPKKQQIICTAQSLHVVVFEDTRDSSTSQNALTLPVLRVILSDLDLSTEFWQGAELKFATTAVLRAEYYSNRLDLWEPFIEACTLHAHLFRIPTHALAHPYSLKVAVAVQETFNVNISRAFLEILVNYLQNLQEHEANLDEKEQHRAAFNPFIIQNDLGVAVQYRTEERGKSGPWLALAPGEHQPLHFAVTAFGRGEGRGVSLRVGNMVRERLPVERLVTQPLDGPPTSHREMGLLWQVFSRAGSRVASVRSNVSIENCTNVQFQMCLSIDGEQDQIITLEPRKRSAIPAAFIWRNGALKFRPAGFDYDWPAQQLRCTKVIEGHAILTCHTKDSEVAAVNVLLEVIKQRADHKSNRFQYQLTLRPPVVLENLLAMPLLFKVMDDRGRLLTTGTVDRGGETAVFQGDPSRPLFLAVQILPYRWSEPVPISGQRTANCVAVVDERDLTLDVCIENTAHKSSARRVALYVRCWLINQTGLCVLYKRSPEDRNILFGQSRALSREEQTKWRAILSDADPRRWYQFQDSELTFPLMASVPVVSIQAGESIFSEELHIGSKTKETGVFEIPVQASNARLASVYNLGVDIEQAPGVFWRTVFATFMPAYVLVNNTQKELLVGQFACPPRLRMQPGERCVYHWTDASTPKAERLMKISFNLPGCSWSGGFRVDGVSSFDVKVWQSPEKRVLVHVSVELHRATLFVIFEEEREFPTYRISNTSNFVLSVRQQGELHAEIVAPRSTLDYAWDRMVQDPRLVVSFLSAEGLGAEFVLATGEYDLDALQEHPPIVVQEATVLVAVRAQGPVKVLEVGEMKPDVTKPPAIRFLEFSFSIRAFGVSLLDERPAEILYLSLEAVRFDLTSESDGDLLEVLVGRLQMDNQLYDTPYPIVLYPLSGDKSFAHLSVVRSKEYATVNFFQYLGFQMQEMDIRLDELFVSKMLELARVFSKPSSRQSGATAKLLNPSGDFRASPFKASLWVDDPAYRRSKMIYFELLHINPVKASLSYCATPGLRSQIPSLAERGERRSGGGWVEWAVRHLGLLANMELVPLRMNALLLVHAFTTQKRLITLVARHYEAQAMSQLYRIIGSSEFIGSPVSLVSNLGTGVIDFFYEPAQGLVRSPKDFGRGVATGTRSLISNTIYGLFNTASKITGTISKVAEVASMDDTWQRERELERMRSRPSHVGSGLLYGFKDLGMGLYNGVTGIYEKPMEGLQREGGFGLLKGIGLGVSGVVIKPVVGAIDLVTKTTEGIRNTTTFFGERERHRIRLPRHIADDGVVRPYSREAAIGVYLLRTQLPPPFNTEDTFVSSLYAGEAGSRRVFVISLYHILLADIAQPTQPLLEWFERLQRVRALHKAEKGVILLLQNSDPQDPTTSQRYVPCESQKAAEELIAIVCGYLKGSHTNVSSPVKQ